MDMQNIEKISLIDKDKLSEEFYFASLIEEAFHNHLLLGTEIETLQLKCLELLAEKTERFTDGESSSVPVEVAENIYKSNLYTIGLYLKSLSCPDDAVTILKQVPLSELYVRGRKQIETKLKIAKHLHIVVMKNIIETDQYAYRSTVIGGIKGFFKLYNADFGAHEIHITVDYPLCNKIDQLVGIEFIIKYLESVYYENMFCNCFSSDFIHHLLCGYDLGYRDLVFNLFEQVLTCAIGCTLLRKTALDLTITAIQVEQIYTLFSDKSKEEVEIIILATSHTLMKDLALTSLSLQTYLETAMHTIASNIYHAIKIDKLNRVFVSPNYPEANSHIHFSFGEKMDNDKYRHLIEEIIQCRYLSDKIAMIKREIKSLADLEDLFLDAELTSEETKVVLKELEVVEIAALAKQHFYRETESIDLDGKVIAFRLCLNDYIHSLSQEKQSAIAKAISMMNNNVES
jgi:hypothetical protein